MGSSESSEYVLHEYVDSAENRRRLFSFYASHYRGKDFFLDDGRFEWQCLKNPLLPPGKTYLYTLEDQSGKIVGHDLLVPYLFKIGEETRSTLANTNLIVSPELAGKGQGRRLLAKHEGLGPVCWGIGSTPVALHVLATRGWTRVHEPRLYALFFKPRACLTFSGVKDSIALLATPAIQCLNLLWPSAYKRRSLPGKSIAHEGVESFRPEWDAVWNKSLAGFGMHYVRTASHLNWKYFSRRDVKHHVLVFGGTDSPKAYVVYRLSELSRPDPQAPESGTQVDSSRSTSAQRARAVEPTVVLGRIVDLVCDPSVRGLHTHVVATAVRELMALGVDGVCGLASTDDLKRAYKANGMVVSSPRPASMLERGFSIAVLRKHYRELWYLTLGDADLDDYW